MLYHGRNLQRNFEDLGAAMYPPQVRTGQRRFVEPGVAATIAFVAAVLQRNFEELGAAVYPPQ